MRRAAVLQSYCQVDPSGSISRSDSERGQFASAPGVITKDKVPVTYDTFLIDIHTA